MPSTCPRSTRRLTASQEVIKRRAEKQERGPRNLGGHEAGIKKVFLALTAFGLSSAAAMLVSTTGGLGLAHAAIKHAKPSDGIDAVENVMRGLAAGDELLLADGTYELGGRFDFDLHGTAAQPIIIRAETGAHPHFHRSGEDNNLWDVRAEYVVIQGLRFSGGSAGIRVESGNHLTIQDCEIFGTQDVGIRMNEVGQTFDGMQILRNEIHDTGQGSGGTAEGMYLGCNDNGCRLGNSLIQGNHVYNTNGSGVTQGDGIELKEGGFNTVISDNVIHDTNYPCILTYSAVGNGGPNIIERNLLYHCGDHAIQSAADATIRNNIILSANANGIAMQQHQAGSPSNLVVEHNTIFKAANTGISVSGATGSVLIANNAIYANGTAVSISGGGGSVVLRGNVGTGSAPSGLAGGNLSADFVSAHMNGAPPINPFPTSGSALRNAGDARDVPADDFNGTARNGVADVGAYAYSAGGNPGWTLSGSMKGEVVSPPVEDGGVPDSGSSTDAGQTTKDAGTTTDSGTRTDAGSKTDASTTTDAGNASQSDGGASGVDANASSTADESGLDGGCGCESTHSSSYGSSGRSSVNATFFVIALLAGLVLPRLAKGRSHFPKGLRLR